MGQFEEAKELIKHAKSSYLSIQNVYQKSLTQKEISTELLIEIKNIMENLRSALDYSAHGLFGKYGDRNYSGNIYFPYALQSWDLNEFRRKNVIENKIPGISATRPDIVLRIESYQHFNNPQNRWLPIFMDLNNESKHQNLLPQERKEKKHLNITSGNTMISMGGNATIHIPPGGMIQMGGSTILGGQTISADNPPIMLGPGKNEVIIWVSFHFKCNDEPVLPFLETSINGVDKIVNELSNL
jgi:hypothetical protein